MVAVALPLSPVRASFLSLSLVGCCLPSCRPVLGMLLWLLRCCLQQSDLLLVRPLPRPPFRCGVCLRSGVRLRSVGLVCRLWPLTIPWRVFRAPLRGVGSGSPLLPLRLQLAALAFSPRVGAFGAVILWWLGVLPLASSSSPPCGACAQGSFFLKNTFLFPL